MVTTLTANPEIDRRAIPPQATESVWRADDGWPIRRIDWPAKTGNNRPARGGMLFLTGRGDHYEKYIETLDYYAQQGWHVTSIDWRGQAGSGRFLADPHVGYIDDFATWINDVGGFYIRWCKENQGPHVVMAHSMGGHLAMRAAIDGAIHPDALILSAPMLSIQSGGLPLWISRAYAKFMLYLGRGKKPAWKVSEKPRSAINLRRPLLTHDVRRYDDEMAWWEIRPELKLGPASWRWVERAIASIRHIHDGKKLENMNIPTLMLATKSDQLVSTKQIMIDAKRLPNCELLMFERQAAHELLREIDEVRDQCLEKIDAFLDEVVPSK